MILHITCNPYAPNPFPRLEYDLGGGKERISPHSSLGRVEDDLLEKNLSAYSDWEGLFAEADKLWGEPVAEVFFHGSWEDYCKVKRTYEEYAVKNFPEGATHTDDRLAKNISPENRQPFLISRYENWRRVSFECALDDMWRDCRDILNAQAEPAEKLIKVKTAMNDYLRENFPADKKNWSRALEISINTRRLYEGKLILSTAQALKRLEEFEVLSKSLLNLTGDLADVLKAAAKEITPPEFTRFMELVINGQRGAWRKHEDALYPMQKFRAKVSRYVDEIKAAWVNILEGKIPFTPRSQLSFKIELTTCVMKSYKPAYFPGQVAGEIVTEYIDVATYEKNLLASVQTQILIAAENFSEELRQFAILLADDLPRYSASIDKVQLSENRLACLDEIKPLAEKLTSFDALPEMEGWLDEQRGKIE